MNKMTTYVTTIQENPKLPLFRIFYSDGNDRDEIGRVSAKNVDEASEYAIKQYLNNEIPRGELIESEDGDEDDLILNINTCLDCDIDEIIKDNEYEDKDEACENCENHAYLEIMRDDDEDPEYRTIQGVDEYVNLETGEKPHDYNALLAKAWRINSQLGTDVLVYTTINDNPKLCESISPEYLHRVNEAAKKVRQHE